MSKRTSVESGMSNYSKKSEDQKAKIRAASLAYYHANKDRRRELRNAADRARYAAGREVRAYGGERKVGGLPVSEFNRMLVDQGGVCKVCKRPPNDKQLAVDHCHKTGKVRGLLCTACNFAIGLFQDDPETCEAAAAYLRNPTPPPTKTHPLP